MKKGRNGVRRMSQRLRILMLWTVMAGRTGRGKMIKIESTGNAITEAQQRPQEISEGMCISVAIFCQILKGLFGLLFKFQTLHNSSVTCGSMDIPQAQRTQER